MNELASPVNGFRRIRLAPLRAIHSTESSPLGFEFLLAAFPSHSERCFESRDGCVGSLYRPR